MNTALLEERVCKDLIGELHSWNGRSFFCTPFDYPDGDSINIYLNDTGTSLSDRGTTLFKIHGENIELTERRRQYIGYVCRQLDVVFAEQEQFTAPCDPSRPEEAVQRLIQAITFVASWMHSFQHRRSSALREQILTIIDSEVRPYRNVYENWTHDRIDPDKAFPVDFRCNGERHPRHLFCITSRERSSLVAATNSFLYARGLDVPTLSVVDPDISLTRNHYNRIAAVSTHIRTGVTGNEDFITSFALGEESTLL